MAAAAAAAPEFESLVVVHNIAKRHNVGTMARSATAFGVSEMILVGRRDFNAFGSHGSTSHLRFRHFTSLAQAHRYLKINKPLPFPPLSLNPNPSHQSRSLRSGGEGLRRLRSGDRRRRRAGEQPPVQEEHRVPPRQRGDWAIGKGVRDLRFLHLHTPVRRGDCITECHGRGVDSSASFRSLGWLSLKRP